MTQPFLARCALDHLDTVRAIYRTPDRDYSVAIPRVAYEAEGRPQTALLVLGDDLAELKRALP